MWTLLKYTIKLQQKSPIGHQKLLVGSFSGWSKIGKSTEPPKIFVFVIGNKLDSKPEKYSTI